MWLPCCGHGRDENGVLSACGGLKCPLPKLKTGSLREKSVGDVSAGDAMGYLDYMVQDVQGPVL